MTEEVKKDLRAIPKIEGDPALSALLTTDEKEAYFNSVTTAMGLNLSARCAVCLSG